MGDETRTKRRWLQFSLATFLFASICIGAIIAGYQSGYRRGYISGDATRQDETQVSQAYSTRLFIWPDLPEVDRVAGCKSVKDLIESTIATDIWNDRQGNEVRVWPDGHSVVVTAPGWVQREIRDLFNQLESFSAKGGADQFLPVLQALSSKGQSQGKSQDTILSVSAPKESQMANSWLEKYFSLTVDGISKLWGAPRFRGECRDTGFPEWSLDQRIATWRRGGGLSYLALRIADDGQLHLAAGWRDKS